MSNELNIAVSIIDLRQDKINVIAMCFHCSYSKHCKTL